jgi:hypothetical protein
MMMDRSELELQKAAEMRERSRVVSAWTRNSDAGDQSDSSSKGSDDSHWSVEDKVVCHPNETYDMTEEILEDPPKPILLPAAQILNLTGRIGDDAVLKMKEMSLDNKDELFQKSDDDHHVGDSLRLHHDGPIVSVMGRQYDNNNALQQQQHHSSVGTDDDRGARTCSAVRLLKRPAAINTRRMSLEKLGMAQEKQQEQRGELIQPGAYSVQRRAFATPFLRRMLSRTFTQRGMHNHTERRASQRAQQQRRGSRFPAAAGGVAADGEDDDGYTSVEEEVIIDAAAHIVVRKDEHEKEPLERRSLRDKFMDCLDCLVDAFGCS